MTVEEYYANAPAESTVQLQKMRTLIQDILGTKEEVISYSMPTFVVKGKKVVSIAGYKHHIGFYPNSNRQVELFKDQITPRKMSKGAIQFTLTEDLPKDLIRRIVEDRLDVLFADVA